MSTSDTARITRFKQRVGFDAAIATQNPNEAVVVEWPDFMTAAPLAQSGPGWAPPERSITCVDHGCSLLWTARRGKETVELTVFVAERETSAAAERLLARASASMMVEIPMVRGPDGLGALSLASPAGEPAQPGSATDSTLMWVYRNVFFALELYDSRVDALALARAIDAFARQGLVSKSAWQLRRPPSLAGPGWQTPMRAPPGTAVTIKLADGLPAGALPADYLLRVDRGTINLEILGVREGAVEVRGKAAGPGQATLQVVQARTLLSRSMALRFEFGP